MPTNLLEKLTPRTRVHKQDGRCTQKGATRKPYLLRQPPCRLLHTLATLHQLLSQGSPRVGRKNCRREDVEGIDGILQPILPHTIMRNKGIAGAWRHLRESSRRHHHLRHYSLIPRRQIHGDCTRGTWPVHHGAILWAFLVPGLGGDKNQRRPQMTHCRCHHQPKRQNYKTPRQNRRQRLGCIFRRNFGEIQYITVLSCRTQRNYITLCQQKTEN